MDQGVSEKELKRLLYKGKNPDFFTDPIWEYEPMFDADDDFSLPVLFRSDWAALPPTSQPEPLQKPISHIRFIPTNTNKQVDPDSAQALQVYQKFYMIYQGLPDMPYNFLIDVQGVAYEVAGWHNDVPKTEEFSHLKGKCLDIGLLGDFRHEDTPYPMMRAALELIKFGIKKKIVIPNFQVIPFRKKPLRKSYPESSCSTTGAFFYTHSTSKQ